MSDLISRADAIEAVCDLYRISSLFSGGSDRREDWYEKAEKLLSKCPSADADRPHGHWIRQDKYFQAFNETVTTYKCSVCGHEPYFGGDIIKLNYCPSCGARMKGGAK